MTKSPRDQIWFQSILQRLPSILFLLSVIFSWITAYLTSTTLLDSDTSSVLVLSNLLAQQNKIVTSDFFYSTEIMLWHNNLIFAPLFKLFSDWHVVRFIGTVVLQSIYLLSYRYLCKQAQFRGNTFFITASILILPYSIVYGRTVLYHLYYLPYVSLGFVLAGLYLRVMRLHSSPDQRRPLIVLMVLALLSGLNGLRILLTTCAPMLLTAAVMTAQREHRQSVKASDSHAPILSGWHGIWVAFGVCVAGTLGYLLNVLVLSPRFDFQRFDQTAMLFASAEEMQKQFSGFLAQYGFQGGRSFFSLGGLLALGGAFVSVYFGVRALRTLWHTTDLEVAPAKFIQLLFPLSVLLTCVMFLFTEDFRLYTLYFVPVAVWVVPALGTWLDQHPIATVTFPLKSILLWAVCALLLANGVYNNLYLIKPDPKTAIYEGLWLSETDTVAKLKPIIPFLQDNGYTMGYATHWNANVLTEVSNGQFPMASVQIENDGSEIHYHNWLTNKLLRDPAYSHKQKAFVLLDNYETSLFYFIETASDSVLVYEDANYSIFGFENQEEMIAFVDSL